MGVEYRHFIVVNEPEWIPHLDTAHRVEAVLRRWSIVDSLEKKIDLEFDANREIRDASLSTIPGAGVAFVYSGINGEPVERIAGSSSYADVTSTDRYTMRTTLVVGHDYRVHWSSEGIYFKLVSPPIANGQPVVENGGTDPYNTLFSQSFSSARVTHPPVVIADIGEYTKPSVAWDRYQGYWRGAVVIDFGKDIPAFANVVHMLPAHEFVASLGEAFRGSVVEVGEFY